MTHEDQPPLSPPMDAISDTMLPPGPESLRDLPTNPENLKPSPYDTDFIRKLDPEFARAIEVMATLGRDIVADREERRALAERSAENQLTIIEQQKEVIEILRRTEKATEANYEILKGSIQTVQASAAAQSTQLREHQELLARLDIRVAALENARDSNGPPEAPPTTQ